jgi:hypothetical protein
METKRVIEIEKIIVDGEISHWLVRTSNWGEKRADSFLDAWEDAYEMVTGDFGHLQHDGFADFPEAWKEG